MEVIRTENISKRFGEVIAVDDVSLHVRAGEIYGFLGLNGAGKTTTIRLLLGMIKPNAGIVRLFGEEINQSSQIWNDVGYLVETPYSYPDLSVRENLELFRRLRGLNNANTVDEVIKHLKLEQYSSRKARHLSMGNKQRLGLAKALMHKPKLLILDEPINGLDPAGIVEIRELLKDLVDNHGTTIFISSHILSEIAKLATRIGIVHQGKLVTELNTNELEDQLIRKLRVNTVNNQDALKLLNEMGVSANLNGEDTIETDDARSISNPEKIAELLVTSGVSPKMLYVYEEDLESYFLRIIGRTE